MAITAAMVKELREMTGAGMMDCKKALNETNGNMDEAVEYLRKNGQAKAEKKAGRIAAEGLCKVVTDGDKTAAVVEVNSETDFVAKNAEFQNYVTAVAEQALATTATDIDTFLAEAWKADASKTVKDALVEKIAVIGENLSIRRFEKVVEENGCVVTYTHGGALSLMQKQQLLTMQLRKLLLMLLCRLLHYLLSTFLQRMYLKSIRLMRKKSFSSRLRMILRWLVSLRRLLKVLLVVV